jgi:hypothetical protein
MRSLSALMSEAGLVPDCGLFLQHSPIFVPLWQRPIRKGRNNRREHLQPNLMLQWVLGVTLDYLARQ